MKIKNSTPCKIVTYEDFNLKLGTRDYVVDIAHHATFGSNRFNEDFPSNRGNITLLWLFCYTVLFSRSRAQIESSLILTVNGSNYGPFWDRDDGWRHMGKICPKNSPKRGVNRQFQAKTPQSIHRNISGTINPTNKRYEDQVTNIFLSIFACTFVMC